MQCGRCAAEAAPGSRFCAQCGAPLERSCAGCGAPAAVDARFCSKCGAALGDRTAAESAAPPAASRSDGERRQLTVFFADVVGATALSGHMDPEALRALLRAYQGVCVESVARYGGTIHQYLGDGVLAYFGYPAAHDNDAERAILAGLAVVAGARRLTDERRTRGESGIAVRIGIHTGLVVVGEMGAGASREMHAIGETPNVAARIQAEARPDSVCISAATLRLAGKRFQIRSLGPRALKGVAAQTELFAVDGVLEPAAGLQAASMPPLVGRGAELQHLLERWELAKLGRGQAVLLSGEGGIGKSRLLAAFRGRADAPAGAWRNIFCSPFYQNSALQPMIDLIERAMGRGRADTSTERAAALRRMMEASGVADDVGFALMGALLGLGDEHERALRGLAPDQRRRRTMDALIDWMRADAQRHPLIIIVEDLHWIDASTRDLFGTLLERIAELPILVVLTFRPEFVPAWALHGHVSMIALARLVPEQIKAVALNAAGGRALPASILEEVVRRTDGVPLFVEELTKAIVASGLEEEQALEIPATLRDSLTARLDRLGAAKAVAQLASALGREFDYPVLHAVCDLPEADLEARLADLNGAEIIHQRGVPPRSHYVFKHALIQEAAYDTLLISVRRQHHRRIAEIYEQRFPEVAQSRPELVAHHYSRALLPAPALTFWQRAGELAVARSGYAEALGHLNAALEQLELLPDTAERAATELVLRVRIGPAMATLKGFNSPEHGANYERACRLAETLGDRPERFAAMWGDWVYKTTSGRTGEATRRAEELVALGKRLGDDEFVLQAHHARWTNFFVLGDARVSRADTLEGIRLYDRERHRDHKHLYGGHDPGVCALGVGANAAWLTGHAGEALGLADSVLAIARELDHPFSLSLGLVWSTCVFHCAGEHARARAGAEDLIAVSERHGFRQWTGGGMVMSGASQVAHGATAFGLKLVEEGLALMQTTGQKNFHPFHAAAGAQAHLRAGNHGRALELITEAVDMAKAQNIGWYLPEMERVRTETLLPLGNVGVDEAVRSFEAAAKLAGEQSATVLQRRANLSLARLLLKHGRSDEAVKRLRAVCDAPAGDPEIAELREARALLADAGASQA